MPPVTSFCVAAGTQPAFTPRWPHAANTVEQRNMPVGRRMSSSAFVPAPLLPAFRPSLPRRSVCRMQRPERDILESPARKPVPITPPKPSQKPREPAPPSEAPPRLSNPQIIAERFSDTAYDVYLHFKRLLKFKSAAQKHSDLRKVVILGSGWGAHSLIKVIDVSSTASVTVISPRNFFFFTPLLSSTAVGTTEFRSIVEPIRHSNPLCEYFEAYATDVDIDRKVVKCRGGQREGFPRADTDEFEVPYDALVVAVGETTTTFGVSGAREYAYFLKEISDARRLRVALLDAMERAALPTWTDDERRRMLHFVVCGGGPTGCEFAGELADFVAADLAPRYGKKLVSLIKVTLLQSGDSLLTQFEESLQSLAMKNFAERVNVELNARVVEVTKSEVALKDGRRIGYGILVWAAGNATRPIVAKLVEKITGEPMADAIRKRRKLSVDPWLRVNGVNSIFSMGDCSVIDGRALPATAQVAGQQGAYLGRLLSKASRIEPPQAPVLRDDETRKINPFQFLSLGVMAYLGNDRAVVQVETSPSNNLALGGRIAFFLWRSVYAVKQVDVRNRILVLFDWFKTKTFGRDVSQF